MSKKVKKLKHGGINLRKVGVANLPLHGGECPSWLFNRMVKLSKGISDAIIYEYGGDEFLRRLSDPFWFQALGCVIGFDYHSSGLTTTTCGALKIALQPETGIKVAGGKGKTSRKTLSEIEKTADVFSLSENKIKELQHASRLSAKIDNNCVQDNFQLYHHCFVFSGDGKWAVIQQGMRGSFARRYHWLSDNVKNFVQEPHSAICCNVQEENVLDLTAKASAETQKVSLDLIRDNPAHLRKYGQRTLTEYAELEMSAQHTIEMSPRILTSLKKAYEIQPQNYEELVAVRGLGAKSLRALALISELIYGTKPSWQDPAKFAFAHGGKDGIPFPVERAVYDESISVLRTAIDSAKIGEKEKLGAIKRLKDFI